MKTIVLLLAIVDGTAHMIPMDTMFSCKSYEKKVEEALMHREDVSEFSLKCVEMPMNRKM